MINTSKPIKKQDCCGISSNDETIKIVSNKVNESSARSGSLDNDKIFSILIETPKD